jgi:ATP-dependent Lon protease
MSEQTESSQNSNVPVDLRKIFPSRLLLVPLAQRPLFPGIITPVMIEDDKLSDEVSQRIKESDFLGFVLKKTHDVEEVNQNHIHRVGVVAKVIRSLNMPDGHINVFINSLERFVIKQFIRDQHGVMEVEV